MYACTQYFVYSSIDAHQVDLYLGSVNGAAVNIGAQVSCTDSISFGDICGTGVAESCSSSIFSS